MRVPFLLRVLGPAVLVASPLVACGDGGDHFHEATPGGTGTAPSGTDDAGSTTPSSTPLLVQVDPNKTLTATPGEGVGIFIEYQSGGHWHVWWTCDTSKTGLNCAFDIKGSIASGVIANGQTEDGTAWGKGSGDSVYAWTVSPQSFEAADTITTTVDGVRFDAPPGSVVTLNATLGGLEDGSFFFFVQNGQINGGYTGQLTDPLEVEASTP